MAGDPDDLLATVERGTFEPLLGRRFRLIEDGTPVLELRLSRVSGCGPRAAEEARGRGQRVPFSLLFHGPTVPLLPQRIYHIEEESLGALELFLVPLGPDEHGMRYEAIFA
jgi:hypothetical protein